VAALVRVVAALAPASPVHLWLITSGLHDVAAAERMPFPVHGAIAGLARAIVLEHPELACTHLDLSSEPAAVELGEAVSLIRRGTAEQQTLLRGTRRLVARYRHTKTLMTAGRPSIRRDGTYLVTGGLGGVGRHVARWLVSRGARSIVLTGRSAPGVEAAAVISELEAQGATIRVVLADLSHADDVAKLTSAIGGDAPLLGVFHLAGVIGDELLVGVTAESFRRVLRPKMAAALNLHRGLAGRPLDFWISFSSIAAVVTQPGQATYAAANAFVDGLARYHTARGERMQSLQWGPWANTGFADEAGVQRNLRAYAAQGIGVLAPDAGLSILEYAIGQSAPVALAADVDWTQLVTTVSEQAIANEFGDLVPASPSGDGKRDESALRDRLGSASSNAQRSALLEEHVREQLAVVLKTSAGRIDPRKPMGSMGVDSLLALEFVRRLSRSTGVKLPATAVFNYPTIAALAKNIEARMATGDAPARSDASARPSETTRSELDIMSDDDALRALVAESRAPR
jgi:NAD(P)-dependent dehydrogenase (short-subunit alcohol dehydrogenase family)/acyl carrier protein